MMHKIPLLLALAAPLIAAPREVRLPDPEEVERPPGLQWVGPVQPVPDDLAGEWSWTADGHRVWRARLRASGAHALRLRFESFSTLGQVLLYADGADEPAGGPYTGGGPHRDGGFWSGFVPGEAVMVEFRPAEAVPAVDVLPFRLHSLARIDLDGLEFMAGPKKRSGPRPRAIAGCHLDASCFPNVEDRESPSVALVFVSGAEGTHSCTGFLINPRYEIKQKLLMLTAGHCVVTPEQARDAAFLWRYQTETCYGAPDWEQWEDRPIWTTGAELLVSRTDKRHDFALLALDRSSTSYAGRLTHLGWWARLPRNGYEVFTFGHPAGNHKRAAVGTVVSHRWQGRSSTGFLTVQWRLGTVENGSSGSPLLANYDGQDYVVGVLSGSSLDEDLDQDSPWGPRCDAGLRTAFNRFDAIYDLIEEHLENEPGGSTTPQLVRATVALGLSGETVTLVQDEAGAWWLGNTAVVSGTTTVRASNGNSYKLVLEPDGRGGTMWVGEYVPLRVTVRLGTSNYRVTLTRAEDGTWWRGTTEATEGMTILTPAGTRYRLSFVNGAWVATEVTG